MGNFIGSVYCIFESLFGSELANYLWGNASPEQTDNLYVTIGLSMFVISIVFAFLFYKIVDHPQFNTKLAWGISAIVNSLINFFVAFIMLLSHESQGLMYEINPATQLQESLCIDHGDFIAFGVSNFIIAAVIYFVISLLMKRLSTNCWTVPF